MVALDLNTLLFLLFVLKSWSLSTRVEPPSGSSPGLSSSVDANYPRKRISHDVGKNEIYSTEHSWKEQALLKSEVRSAGRLVGSDLSRAVWLES